jgi:hypothetical protein
VSLWTNLGQKRTQCRPVFEVGKRFPLFSEKFLNPTVLAGSLFKAKISGFLNYLERQLDAGLLSENGSQNFVSRDDLPQSYLQDGNLQVSI